MGVASGDGLFEKVRGRAIISSSKHSPCEVNFQDNHTYSPVSLWLKRKEMSCLGTKKNLPSGYDQPLTQT